jgi:hypothetical protein
LLEIRHPVPLEFPAWLAVHRLIREGGAPAVPGAGLHSLESAVALAWAAVVPAAEALGLVLVETDARGVPLVRPSAALAAFTPETQDRPIVASGDGEALVFPGPRSIEALFLLGRVGELKGPGDVFRYELLASRIAAAQATGCDLESVITELRPLVRNELPAGFERTIRETANRSVRARTRVLHVLDIPQVGAADRAARVLGDRVLDRLTPTLLALTGPLTPALVRALAREGVFVEGEWAS